MFEDLSLMMDNVLVRFEGAGYSFYFVSNFEVLKVTPDSVHGQAGTHTTLTVISVQETRWKSLTAGQSL